MVASYNVVPIGNNPSIMGNLAKEPLDVIWHRPRYTELRQKFLAGQVENMLCAGCTKDAIES
jgi:hypothetical protein